LLKLSAKHLGIQQKTLLDQLIENETILNILAREVKTDCRNDDDSRAKTFVLSKKALNLINDMLYRYDISLDILVDLSITRRFSYIESLSKKAMIKEDRC
jgi:hypothetical protein